jgi:hypothetical protein
MMLQEIPVKIERVRAIGNHRTFEIPPIKHLIQAERIKGITIEPFPFQSKLDAFEYLSQFKNNSVDFGLIDPPYSKRQVSDHYKELGVKVTGWHTSSGWTAKVKFEVGRVMKIGGKTITFGWNSSGIGPANGFEVTRILLVCHGGDHYDTICTVETKVRNRITPIQEGSE